MRKAGAKASCIHGSWVCVGLLMLGSSALAAPKPSPSPAPSPGPSDIPRPKPSSAPSPSPSPSATPETRSTLLEMARLIRPTELKDRIAELSFTQEDLPVQLIEVGGTRKMTTLLEGKLPQKSGSLLRDNEVIPRGAGAGAFRYEIPLDGGETVLKLSAVEAKGNVHPEKVKVVFAPYADYMAGKPPAPLLLGLTLGAQGFL